MLPPSVETLVVLPLLEKQITSGAARFVSGAQLIAVTGTDGVEMLHVGVAAPGFVLVAIR